MWSYDANVSFIARSNESDATLEKIRAAASREQLNGMYVKNGMPMVLDGGHNAYGLSVQGIQMV